jgi:hypothetical protein
MPQFRIVGCIEDDPALILPPRLHAFMRCRVVGVNLDRQALRS